MGVAQCLGAAAFAADPGGLAASWIPVIGRGRSLQPRMGAFMFLPAAFLPCLTLMILPFVHFFKCLPFGPLGLFSAV